VRLGVLCSGGDAPGMNACLRAVVRSAASTGHGVMGIRHGYQGLIDEDFFVGSDGLPRMSPRSVSHIIQRGGTILRSRRCEDFRTEVGLQKATQILCANEIDGLVVIGGDGTFRGASDLGEFWDGKIIGCPATIDNDLSGTDYTIGFPTAVSTAVEAIDKLRDTAESHERLFLVEVMGRNSGYLALFTALASGAELACVPETRTDVPSMVQKLTDLKRRGKASVIVVVAEGDEEGGAEMLDRELIAANCPFPTRTVILGHLQRGGPPTPADRILASRLGDFAVRALADGKSGAMVGEIAGHLVLTPFKDLYQKQKPLPRELFQLQKRMSV
jgi:6-phosphofructokinase 1